ncbi:hypothetical protein C2845_PM17G03520 [Panicum miliaceum]|uniref:Protein kinase domain-containing protein n=1 Tax=Panicum miliaceum TaxID=4540 RepID=A0A3L6Q1Z0_PANMI|nr:hypothetical protein C2845_PM17G03520 [Panicum miliaceum]
MSADGMPLKWHPYEVADLIPWNIPQYRMSHEFSTEDYLETKLHLSLQYLRDITDNFSPDRELGRGGFGVVYKGTDTKSRAVIAVKRLKQILGEQDKQFKNEVNHLAKLNHDNIVKLIGYCDETKVRPVYDDNQHKYVMAEVQEKLLCYEYLSNGSLDNIIFNESLGRDWQDRYKIIIGICQGLHNLHEGVDDQPIIHMDLKPSNILLDDKMVPKIADFGLSRIFSEEQTRTCTMNVMGSIGYMAPEYCLRGEISTKSDIYSLGILIMEVVTGKKNHQVLANKSGEHFIENVRKNWCDMSQIASKHPSLGTEYLEQDHHNTRDTATLNNGSGKSKPFTTTTKVVSKSLNPIWNETFAFIVEDGLHDMLMLEVYHHGTFRRRCMGRCMLTLTHLLEGGYRDETLNLEGAKSGKLNLRLRWTPYSQTVAEREADRRGLAELRLGHTGLRLPLALRKFQRYWTGSS